MRQEVARPRGDVAQGVTACATYPCEGYVVCVDQVRRSPSLRLSVMDFEGALAGVSFARAWYGIELGFDPRRICIRRVERVTRPPASRPTWALMEEVFRAV